MEPQLKPRGQSFQKSRFVVSRESIDGGIQTQPPTPLSYQELSPLQSRTRKIFTISVVPKEQVQDVKASPSFEGENSNEDSKIGVSSLNVPMPRSKKRFHITRTSRQSTDLWELFNFPQRNSTGSSSSSGNLNKNPTTTQSRSDYDPLIDIF